MNQENPEEVLLSVIDTILDLSNQGKQAKAQHLLPFVYESVMRYPQLLWNNEQVWKIAKIFLVMHHYDMVEEEDEEMKMLHMAFVYAQRAIELCEANKNLQDDYFKALHTQIMLLSSCSDYYADTIADICSKKEMTQEERMVALRLANRILPIISYNIVVKVDDNFENFNGDEFLADMCTQFEQGNPDIQPKQLDDAQKIHKMLIHTYLKFFK